MLTLPSEGSTIILQFRSLFTKRSFALLIVLIRGAILAIGPPTICSVLRFCGMGNEKAFHKYHRFLSRARWSSLKASPILVDLLISCFCTPGEPLLFGIDQTIERRSGSKIKAKGIYRDPVRSSGSHFVKCSGLRWMCLMLLTPIPWAASVWALPFLCALAASERYCTEHKKKHKKITDWARQMILILSRWLKERALIVVADSSYSALQLLASLQGKATLITRLRLDAALYDPAPEKKKGVRGRPRVKGDRQLTLKERLDDPKGLQWISVTIAQWYDKKDQKMELASGTSVWYHSGMTPVSIRWVLLRDPEGKGEPAALLCTDTAMDGEQVVNYFIRRWTVEVTFRAVRAHLGVETQRQWSDKAIARTTPCLLGLFSIITLWADRLQKSKGIEPEQTGWYQKRLPTFSDALAQVRKQLWSNHNFCTSTFNGQTVKISANWLNFLTDRLAYNTVFN